MRKFLIGPALIGASYAGGSYYGADSEQLVHKSPDEVRDAVEEAASNRGGTMELEGGKPVPYETKVERRDDGGLIVRIMMNGKQAAETDVAFLPESGGKDTLMTVRIHTDHAVLREALAGTSKARLAYAPDWMLNLTRAPGPSPGRRADRAGRGGRRPDARLPVRGRLGIVAPAGQAARYAGVAAI